MEIPKAMIVERIRSQQGAEKANEADSELPDKVDTEANSDLLQKYGEIPTVDGYSGRQPGRGVAAEGRISPNPYGRTN